MYSNKLVLSYYPTRLTVAIICSLFALLLLYTHIYSLWSILNLFESRGIIDELSYYKIFSSYYLGFINIILLAITAILLFKDNFNGYKYAFLAAVLNLYLVFNRSSESTHDFYIYLFAIAFTSIAIVSIGTFINYNYKYKWTDVLKMFLLTILLIVDYKIK